MNWQKQVSRLEVGEYSYVTVPALGQDKNEWCVSGRHTFTVTRVFLIRPWTPAGQNITDAKAICGECGNEHLMLIWELLREVFR
jgi:MoaA/NifB/PqqE/SkfB family radical SAM enzyme